jgi:hypothetical protein
VASAARRAFLTIAAENRFFMVVVSLARMCPNWAPRE